MQANGKEGAGEIGKGHRYLLLGTAVMVYLLVTAGGVVCATESGYGCPDWPGCYGSVVPPLRADAIIEYTHRFIAMLASPLLLGAAVAGWWKTRRLRWVSVPSVLALVLAIVVSVFGALVVLRGLSRGWAAVDLGSALLALALTITAALVASIRYRIPSVGTTLSLRSPFARLAAATTVLLFALLVSGVLVAEGGSIERCLGWPLYRGGAISSVLADRLLLGRRLLAVVATALLAAVALRGRRAPRERSSVRRASTMVGIFLLAHLITGVLLVTVGFNTLLLILYVATVVAVWTFLIVALVAAAMTVDGNSMEE